VPELAPSGSQIITPAPEVQAPAPGKEQITAPALGEKTWRNSIGMDFVLIPAGTYMMGSDTGDNDEKPIHRVRLSKAFYLGKYEVTQGQWQAVMGTNPSDFKGDANVPVKNVSWEDVQEFIRKLNTKEGGLKYRLPTEAEWEYAARAGTTTVYGFGNDERQLGEYAWYGENSWRTTHPVGQKKPNAWGLYDMYGNVWEWVQDWYGPYTAGSAVDPAGPASGSTRVRRGGGWGFVAGGYRSADRGNDPPGYRGGFLGLRLLRTIEASSSRMGRRKMPEQPISSSMGEGSALPHFVYQPKPAYPLIAKWGGREGTVILDIELRADGSVGDIKVVQSSGYLLLDEAALDKVKTWQHIPVKRNGVPVTRRARQSFEFKLD
jgi:TonB family protein